MSSMDYFATAFTKAIERSKQRARQTVQKADFAKSNVDIATPTSSASSAKQSDEQYRVTIINAMINHIEKRKTE